MSYLSTVCCALIMAITLIAGLPLGKPSPKADSLLGITPGNSVSDVRVKIGEPLLRQLLPDGSQVTWNRSSADDAYIMLGERDGTVTSVRVISASVGIINGISDSFGVLLGGNQLGLRTLRGKPQTLNEAGGDQVREYPGTGQLRWRYIIRNDEVHSITLTTAGQFAAANPMPKTPGSAPLLATSKVADPRDGSSAGKAFLLLAKDEDEGARFEHFFVKTLPGCKQFWSIDQHSRVNDHKRHYERVELACGESGNTRSVFFDVTSFFGKVTLPTEIP